MLKSKQVGVTLIELLIGLTIVGILFLVGAPSYRAWIQNQQIRAAAESILNGIQLARSSAVNNNASARFILCNVNSVPSTSTWEILAASAIAAAPTASLACAGANPGSDGVAGEIRVQERSAKEGSKLAQITVLPIGTNTVTFNSLGRVSNVNSNANSIGLSPLTQIDVNSPNGDRPLRINISTGGNVRMCDPSPKLATSDPRHC
jgi:type IV fimbrial biogenesis protein FimT